ncbi:hypothetical protein F511_04213 [Dorcoceras hygrometricum]|uniref:GTD-binding domain-containing protein n=1 Tax=Dorcoceras hygrometricum TaxID=472368 RepID=A0A2Z7BPE8_9LAMI|nr:hypothetical protein F511_04213 [Dorcoceras hygrometricum]
MADYSMVMSQAEVSALKETLCAQQQLLQKLYSELDEEREASATAASEALSVILRLQREKAAVQMEAQQYKRFSEEKMCHAEESLAIIEDIIYQKEMEVAALDYQVQAYRYKLLSMGWVDPGIGEMRFPENLLQRNEALAGEASIQSLGRRNSVPHLLKYKKFVHEKESFVSTETNWDCKIMEENNSKSSDSDKKIDNAPPGDITSYWEQIRKLDQRVKEIAGGSNSNFKNEMRTPSSISSRLSTGSLCDPSCLRNETGSPSPPQLSIGNGCDTIKVGGESQINLIKHPTDLANNGVAMDYSCPPSVYDVFEVPQVEKNLGSCESSTVDRDRGKTLDHGSESLENDGYSGHSKSCIKDESVWLNKLLHLQSNHQGKELCKPGEITDIDCRLSIVQTSTNVSESHPRSNQQLNMRSEIIEIERPSASANREDEIKLLKEITEKLDSLHDEIRRLKIKKHHEQDHHSFHLLAEAMVHFWL